MADVLDYQLMKILIIFETQNGTTQYVSEVIQKQLKDLGHTAQLHSIKSQGMEPDVSGFDVILFGAPTYEDGKLEATMRVFTAKTRLSLEGKKVAVFGLGNSFYPQFCYSADILSDWVKERKGTLITESLKIDAFPDNLTPIENWISSLSQKLV